MDSCFYELSKNTGRDIKKSNTRNFFHSFRKVLSNVLERRNLYFEHTISLLGSQQLDSHLEKIFLSEILSQCKTIQATFEVSSRVLNQFPYNSHFVWGLLSLILTSTSNLSKIFWPSFPSCIKDEEREKFKKYQERGKYLREQLGVSNKSPLNNRRLRNHFEHFDERIHEWYDKSQTKNYSSRNINVTFKTAAPDDFMDMGNFDSRTYVVTFWNVKYELEPIRNETNILLNTTEVKFNEILFKN